MMFKNFFLSAGRCAIHWQCSIHLCMGSCSVFVHGAVGIFHSKMDHSWRFRDCSIDSCRPGGISTKTVFPH